MGRRVTNRYFLVLYGFSFLVFIAIGCVKEEDIFVKMNFMVEHEEGLAPLYATKRIENLSENANYIIVLKDEIDWSDIDFESDKIEQFISSQRSKTFKFALKGFTIKLTSKDLKKVRKDPNVKYVEQDQLMNVSFTQFTAPWGLDRIDQQSIPLNGSYTYETTGSTVDAYIFDTGIRTDHNEFKSRIRAGYNAISPDSIPEDDNGHGTHVAGVIGGTRYGVAKGINLIPVKVLDQYGTGSFSQIIAGIDWAIANHTTRPAVGNVSISGELSVSLDEALKRAIADGIVVTVAAGNNAEPARNASPGRVTEAITVGSVTNSDEWSSFSNFGPEIDIIAPGTNITSAWHTGSNDINTISGTSMATPHVTGAVALYLEKFPRSTQDDIQAGLKKFAVLNVIKNVPDSTANSLLNVFFSLSTTPKEPILLSPVDGSVDHPKNVTLTWNKVDFALSYDVQYSDKTDFSNPILTISGLTQPTYTTSALAYDKIYFWRVRANSDTESGNWSKVSSFKTQLLGNAKPQYIILIPDPVLPRDEQIIRSSRIPAITWSSSGKGRFYNL
jgi:subtilisin family serine protease